MTEAEALALLAGNGRLVKRPFVLGDRFGLVGFDQAEWERMRSANIQLPASSFAKAMEDRSNAQHPRSDGRKMTND